MDGGVAGLRGTLQDITQRKQAEARLVLSESRFRFLIEAAAAIVWRTRPDGACIGPPPEWEAFTGCPPARFMAESWMEALHPDDRAATLHAWQAALQTGAPLVIDHRLRRRDGVYRTMSVRAAPVRDGDGVIVEWTGMHIDVTESRETEELCRRSELEGLAELIMVNLPCATIVTDRSGQIIAVSHEAERLFGYSRDSLVHRATPLVLFDSKEITDRAAALSNVFQETVLPGLSVLSAQAERGIVKPSEWTFFRRDGSSFDGQLTVSAPRYRSGELLGLVLVAEDISARKREATELQYLAGHDALTGLATRRVFQERLAIAIKRAAEDCRVVALLVLDLDGFKRVNDTMGHQVGDALLVHVAGQLRNTLRSSDVVGRVGGDEFVIVLDAIQAATDAERVAELLLHAIHAPMQIGSREITITGSIGIGIFPEDGNTVEALFRSADAAMYRAKLRRHDAGGGGQGFPPRMSRTTSRERDVERVMAGAIPLDELVLWYQPQLSLLTGEVMGVEALVRWHSGALGLVMPHEFIPLAEENGLIGPVGEWVMRQACDDAQHLRATLGRPLTVAVNVSPRQFEFQNLPDIVSRTLLANGLDPRALELEITEGALIGDSPRARRVLDALRAHGVRIAIDDFGAGYGGLASLVHFPIDRLKIDGSFVRVLQADPASCSVTRAIITLAHSLGIATVAEDVESETQHDVLTGMGCDVGQGYFYSAPQSIDQMAGVIRTIEARWFRIPAARAA